MGCNRLLMALTGVFLSQFPRMGCAQEVTGAGSSFAAPIYGAWGVAAEHAQDLMINYQSVGSGAGVNQVMARTVDFGATDKPLDADTLRRNGLYQFPSIVGAIVIIANVSGIDVSHLRLDGETLTGIFDGSIQDWDDPRIVHLNPDLKLPETRVAPFHRADASGTSFVFTSYLSKVSSRWKQEIGAGASVAWPGGAGARGNDGVAAGVRQTDGGIGYLEYAYAAQNHLPMILLANHAGEFVAPGRRSFEATAEGADWDSLQGNIVDLLDTSREGGWPIMSASYVLVPKEATATGVQRFFSEGILHGDDAARKLDYVPLPNAVKMRVFAQWPQHGSK